MNRIRFSALLLVLVLLLGGCAPQEYTQQTFAMDTFMSLSAYGKGADAALDECCAYIAQLEDTLSVTDEESEIYALNHANGKWTNLSEDTYILLSNGQRLWEQTGGALDITAYPAVLSWGFTTEEHHVPNAQALQELTELIDCAKLELQSEPAQARLPEGMAADLGSLAKGYTGQQLRAHLLERGVESALLSLGGNIQAVGAKPDGSAWRVGIQDPDSDQGAYLAAVSVIDKAVVTSGGYQRYFEQDGEIYWHILDPDTAAPARSGVTSATIVGVSGLECDGLSTALFVMGAEKAAAYWREYGNDHGREFDYVLVLEDGAVHITRGLKDSFTLMDGYKGREVTVIS